MLRRTGFQPKQPDLTPKVRMRKCATCRQPFAPRSMTHKTCSPECAIAHVAAEKARKDRKERQEGLAKLKSRATHLKEAQAAVNAWVRLRDIAEGCISCDKPATWNGQWHASHYLSVGASPSTRFDENNIHKACSICNNYLSGNLRAYRPRLIHKIGIDAVEKLEGPHPAMKYDIAALKAIKEEYKRRANEYKRYILP